MTAPQRLIDGGATEFERTLLHSWQSLEPSPEARARVFAKAGLGLGAAAVAATTAKAAGGSIAPKAVLASSVVLKCLGLEHGRRQPIGSLSVGQFQRALFARLLLQSASTILLDEPFNAVDSRTTDSLLALLAQWHAEGRTVVAVLHDLDQVREHFPHSLLLARRIVAWGATERVLTPSNLGLARSCAANWDDERADPGWRATD